MNKRQELQKLIQQAVDTGSLSSLRFDGMDSWMPLGYGCSRARFVQCQEYSHNNGNEVTVEPNITVEQFCLCIPEDKIDIIMHIMKCEKNGATSEYMDY